MLAYRCLRQLLRIVIGVFYRQVEVVGQEHIPREGEGPVIFAGNHPNSLLDPVLILLSCGRIVHFAAKDVLFQSAVLRVFLKTLGAVPVARRSDHGEGAVSNDKAFEAMHEVLVEGRSMGIFPEGLSHDESQLARLKTGAARIAMGLKAQRPDLRIRIVPCGLNYVHRKRFRSRVLVQYGPPIEVTVEAAGSNGAAVDDREAVRALTTDIDRGIRALTVNASDWETLRVLDGVRRLYQPAGISLEERTELARRFNDVYPSVMNEPTVMGLFTSVRAYLDRLDLAGLTDRDLRRTMGPMEGFARVMRHLLLAFVWLPLALPGALLFVPLGLLVRVAGTKFAPRKDVIATTKLVAGMIGTLLVLAAIPLAAAWRGGISRGFMAAAFLVISGYATLRVVERTTALRHLLSTFARLIAFRREIEELRAERDSLEAQVVAAVDRFKPAAMVALFPRSAAPAGSADSRT